MNLSSFLKRNLLGLAGLLIGVFGIALSVYFYIASQVQREPILLFDPTRTEIVSSKRVSEAPIRVMRPDGTEVKSDLIAVRFYFWNQGRMSIRRENILEPVTLKLITTKAQILDARFLRTSREITRLMVSMDTKKPTRSVLIDFRILDHLDGGTGLLIYEGEPKAEFEVSGVIEGVSQIETNRTISPRRLWGEYMTGVVGLLFIALTVVALATVKKIETWLSRLGKKIPVPQVVRTIGSVLLVGVVMVFAAAFGYSLVFEPFLKARTHFQENVAQKVPIQILPSK